MQPPRLAPVPPEQWDDETRELLGKMLRADDGRPLNIFATFARHPKLLKRWLVFAGHVLSKSTLPERDRELLILRTGWNTGAPYEWGQHVAIGREAGLLEEEIERIGLGPDASGWDDHEAALLRAADELHADGGLRDETWTALAGRYDEQQLLEVPFTVGQYHLVAFALNTCRVPLDAGVAPFPERAGAVARVAAVVLPVGDLPAAAARVEAVLLSPARPAGPERVGFALAAGTVLELRGEPTPSPQELHLAVADPGAVRRRALGAGFTGGDGVLVDPDGHRWSLSARP